MRHPASRPYSSISRTLLVAGWLVAGTVVATGLACPPAAARPLRQPLVHLLLHELAQLESLSAERDDQTAAQLIAQQTAASRLALLRVLGGTLALEDGLRTAAASLTAIASLHQRATDRDAESRSRISDSIERLRLQLEQPLAQPGQKGGPQGAYAPLGAYPAQGPAPPPVAPLAGPSGPPTPLGKAAFGGLLKQLQRLSFSDEKLSLTRDAVSSGYSFTCEQVAQLMRTSAFGDDQVKIAATLYPRIVDPQNFIQLTSILTFETDRQKLRQLVGR
jgi:hypothetical protein